MKSFPQPLHKSPNSFTMVELMASVVITALVLGVAATLWARSTRTFREQQIRNDQEALVDYDIARLEDLAYAYTCCPGTCGTNATTISSAATCRGRGGVGTPKVGTEYYYFPYYAPTATSTPAITNMKTLCDNGTLVTALRTTLQAEPFSIPPSDPTIKKPWRVLPTRTVEVDFPAEAHRLLITYTGNNNLKRSTIIVPMVARWCP